MRVIGLTGGIATGKSTVAGMLAARGAVVVDADLLAREVIAPGQPGYDEVLARFGRRHRGRFRRGRPRRARRHRLRRPGRPSRPGGDHPPADRSAHAGAAARRRWRPRRPLAVADIPLLFENGRDTAFPQTLLVYAPAEVQLLRMRQRDGLDAQAARQRLDAQMPIDEKRARATWVIDNGGSLDDTAGAGRRLVGRTSSRATTR